MLKQTTLKLSLRLIVSCIGCDLISFLIFITFGSMTTNGFIHGLFELLCIIIYVAMVYGTAWAEGFKDPNRVNYGHMEKSMMKGLIAGLLADIPFFLAYLFALVTNLIMWHYSVSVTIFRLLNMQFMYSINALQSSNLVFLLFIFCIPLPLIACLAYVLGYKRISIMQKVVYKDKKANDRNSKFNKSKTR